MKVPLKLNAIDQEHLQELYDAAGVARDELPYTDHFEQLWQGFQDRTFKNADREQLFGAIIKYVRSSSNASSKAPTEPIAVDHAKQLKTIVAKHAIGGRILPYSDSFEAARGEFNKVAGTTLDERAFWNAMIKAQGPKRQPPKRQKVAATKPDDDEDVE